MKEGGGEEMTFELSPNMRARVNEIRERVAAFLYSESHTSIHDKPWEEVSHIMRHNFFERADLLIEKMMRPTHGLKRTAKRQRTY